MRRVAWEKGQGEGIPWGSVIVGGHLGNSVSGCQLGEKSEFENFFLAVPQGVQNLSSLTRDPGLPR